MDVDPVKPAFDRVLAFINEPANIVRFQLPQGHLFICDNGAVLHGRSAFPAEEKRRMLRLNLNGDRMDLESILGFDAPLPPGV